MDHQRTWYALPAEKVLAHWQVDPVQGLARRQIQQRRQRYGPNRLREQPRASALRLFLDQFGDFMVLVLLAATAVSYFLGEILDALTIMAIVCLNAILGFVQEFRAERSLQALRRLAAPEARVMRDGEHRLVKAEGLVPGDILLLEAGDRVPADARLLETASLEVEESILTGESVPVTKGNLPAGATGLSLGDQRNMVFQGTTVTRGRARAVVVATGMATEMGHVAGLIQEVTGEATPLQRRLDQLGRYLVAACLAVSGAVVVTGLARGEPPFRMFMAGVSLAVAVIPEGLPAVVTIALALGVQRMIRVNALVRRLPAVETLGCATVICSDKTGTLTRNEMTVRSVWAGGRYYRIAGEGYLVAGGFFEAEGLHLSADEREHPVAPRDRGALLATLMGGALCNNAVLAPRPAEQELTVQGDPTEGALLVAAFKAGIDRGRLAAFRRVAEIPFEPERRRMSILVEDPASRRLTTYLKGAPDVVMARCTGILTDRGHQTLDAGTRRGLGFAADAMAACGLRVLAVASREADGIAQAQEEGLVFLGLLGLLDPPRPEARAAVKRCQDAGIRSVMITGDHVLTAASIARDLGILDGGGILSGQDLEGMTDQELVRAVRGVRVFARVSPRHKLRIVGAFKRLGNVVAMTGDGVNDAPALKEAHIGVAMGIQGSDVTREAADLVLTDDNFASIVAAVAEGRAIYQNIRKFIRYLLSCNLGEALVMFTASLLGWPLPLLPMQILFVNLVTDGLPAIALGVDPPADNLMREPPRPAGEGIFGRGLAGLILSRGLLIGLTTLLVFGGGYYSTGGNLAEARTMALATLTMAQVLHAFDCRSERVPPWHAGFFANRFLVMAVVSSLAMLLAVVYLPALQLAFKTTTLTLADWLLVLAASGFGGIILLLKEVVAGLRHRPTAPIGSRRGIFP